MDIKIQHINNFTKTPGAVGSCGIIRIEKTLKITIPEHFTGVTDVNRIQKK